MIIPVSGYVMSVYNTIMDISTLSFEDTVRIICHFHNSITGNKPTTNDLKSRGYTDEMIAAATNSPTKKNLESCGLRISGNYNDVVYNQFDYIMSLYNMKEVGILPFNGGAAEQPNQIMEIFSLLSLLHLEMKTKQLEEQRKLSNIKARRK
jgi:hypothetical protein